MTQTIGQKLKAVREEKQITLEKAFQATRIRVVYLQALEADDLSSMPSPVQARGYMRNYAEYLGLDIDRLLDELRSQTPSDEIIGPADLTPQPVPSTPEPITVQEDAPLPPPTLDPVQEAEPQPEPVKPKRRGRKKVETEVIPEPEPVVELQPAITEEPAPSQPEPVIDETVEAVQEEVQPNADVNDGLWQTWLNRLSSVISTRINRKSESQEAPVTEEVQSPESPEQTQLPVDATQPISQPVNLQHSDEIFREIGFELRNRRETLSLHIAEVERNTHVKAHYIEALEDGAMNRLPSTVQTRGMLSNYASFLDMDVDAILLRFADALQARHREKNPQQPARKPNQPIISSNMSLSSFVAGDMIFGIGVAVLLVGFAIWGINYVLTVQNERDVQPTAPSISDILLASPDPSLFTATPTFLPVESFSGEATPTIIIPTVNINVSVQVNLVAVERTYMRVIVDDKTAFEGRVIPGNAYLFEAESQIEVLVGSGAAIRVAYNGRDLGLMGTFGQVVSNIYRADGIITPTALPSPTPTETVPPSPTVPPTITPIPSRTPAQ
ncbi:MAG: DUF4115 domain-containing protein [Anaerolineales bacterium]|nr:DUF4115 domain-containing protein [Anaerolineales bacterium]